METYLYNYRLKHRTARAIEQNSNHGARIEAARFVPSTSYRSTGRNQIRAREVRVIDEN